MNGLVQFTLDEGGSCAAVPASQYSIAQLVEIYNESRIDYIVPMPMNARRMEEYIRFYDIDLERSIVAVDPDGAIAGMGMLGVRGRRGWITRLGVMPTRRGRQIGRFVVDHLLANARGRGLETTQLEVIEGNDPAYRLFRRFDFAEVQSLLVLRRPPNAESPSLPTYRSHPLSPQAIERNISANPLGASWLNDRESLINMGGRVGFGIETEGGGQGWITAHQEPFQLSHFALSIDAPSAHAYHETALMLLNTLHRQFPSLDTKFENLPADSPLWPAFAQMGYLETFRRIEMARRL